MQEHNNIKPKVSVTVVTYNHGDWLAQCLESIITQQTDFPFEVIVGDDASTDGRTVEVLREYATKYPNIVIPVYRQRNIGPIANYFDIVGRAKGEYIAHIDGDDYMLPQKLQEQADLLDTHQEIAIAAHRMLPILDDGMSEAYSKDNYPEYGTAHDLLRYGCYFCHSSKMYRTTAVITKNTDLPIVDFYLHIEHANSGGIYYSNKIMGGHRLHAHGISQDGSFRQFIIDAYERAYDRALELGLDKSAVERGRIRHRQSIGLSGLANNNLTTFCAYASIDQKSFPFASLKQLVVHYLSLSPSLAYFFFRVRIMAKNVLRV